jgi:hypothetical protein
MWMCTLPVSPKYCRPLQIVWLELVYYLVVPHCRRWQWSYLLRSYMWFAESQLILSRRCHCGEQFRATPAVRHGLWRYITQNVRHSLPSRNQVEAPESLTATFDFQCCIFAHGLGQEYYWIVWALQSSRSQGQATQDQSVERIVRMIIAAETSHDSRVLNSQVGHIGSTICLLCALNEKTATKMVSSSQVEETPMISRR